MTDAEEKSGEYYLKLENTFIKIDKKGKESKESSVLVEGLKMTRDDIRLIGEILNQLNDTRQEAALTEADGE